MKKRYGLLILLVLAAVTSYLASNWRSTEASERTASLGVALDNSDASPVAQVTHAFPSSYKGGCVAYMPERGFDPEKPKQEIQGQAKRVIDRFFDSDTQYGPSNKLPAAVHFALALAPDPTHTNLGLFFDREIVSIQQAAQDAHYDYDSAWLPWRRALMAPYNNLGDRQESIIYGERQESCPGVLLFRKHIQSEKVDAPGRNERNKSSRDPYDEALLVFVVGEQPTGGINLEQWSNAVLWIRNVAKVPAPSDQILRVLGPTFSGSFPSLERDIRTAAQNFPKILILSGSATSLNEVEAFQASLRVFEEETGDGRERKLSFGTFNENDELHISRFLDYLVRQGNSPEDVAILSEDETAYAVSDPARNSRDRPLLYLKYPRDISVIRDAYQKQSVFESMVPKNGPVRSILRNPGEASSEGLDSLPGFSGSISALDQEARLFGILDHLRAHHVHYIILRSTNPLDLLFLSRFFHRSYPEAHIVTLGSDLLFRREIDTTEFRGTMALSSYSLLPREPDWREVEKNHSGKDDESRYIRAHEVFTGNISEGGYMAARYLFEESRVIEWSSEAEKNASSPSDLLTFNFVDKLPAYGDPNWLSNDEQTGTVLRQPTWVTTLGRDGYWPIAALNLLTADTPPTSMVGLRLQSGENREIPAFGSPLSRNICIALAMLLALYQLWGVSDYQMFTADDLFLVFINNPLLPTQPYLRGVNSALSVMPLLELTLPRFALFVQGAVAGSTGLFWLTSFCFLFIVLILGALTIRRSAKNAKPEEKDPFFDLRSLRKRQRNTAGLSYLVSLAIFTAFFLRLFALAGERKELFPALYRMEHLTDGVSPLLPVLFLTLGFYLWTWQKMAGNLMVGEGRPVLPYCKSDPSEMNQPSVPWMRHLRHRYFHFLGMSEWPRPREAWKSLRPEQVRLGDRMGRRILLLANPFHLASAAIAFLSVFLFLAFHLCFRKVCRTMSLEGGQYNSFLTFALLFAALLTLIEAFRLFSTWVQLRRLLLALGRSRLSNSIRKFKPISASSLWTVSTDVHRVQYRLFHQQNEAVTRLVRVHGISGADDCLREAHERGKIIVLKSRLSIRRGMANLWWSIFLRPDGVRDRNIRETFSDAAAYLMNSILWPNWDKETKSLYAKTLPEPNHPSLTHHPKVEAAEEFVCVHYIAFIHNTIACMRTMTMSAAFLFATLCFALSFYPFAPRNYITSLLFLNFLILGSTVAYVYAGMDRDEILSSIAATRAGHLGGEFWVKLAGFLAGPTIGILATQFPSILDSMLGWMQPGLGAVK